jgi:hypothetical protein
MSTAAIAKSDKSDPRGLFIEIDGPLLTVRAKEIPHRQILEGIAKRLNFELIINGPLEERYSLELEGRPWEEALKKALSPANWALMYESAAGTPRLTKVFVVSPQWGVVSTQGGRATDSLAAAPRREDSPSPDTAQPSEAQASESEQKGVKRSLTELLKAEDQFIRMTVIKNIAAVGGERAVDTLKQGLQDKEVWIRLEAVEALAKIGGEQAQQGLQQALQDEHPSVQQAAQEALELLQ